MSQAGHASAVYRHVFFHVPHMYRCLHRESLLTNIDKSTVSTSIRQFLSSLFYVCASAHSYFLLHRPLFNQYFISILHAVLRLIESPTLFTIGFHLPTGSSSVFPNSRYGTTSFLWWSNASPVGGEKL